MALVFLTMRQGFQWWQQRRAEKVPAREIFGQFLTQTFGWQGNAGANAVA